MAKEENGLYRLIDDFAEEVKSIFGEASGYLYGSVIFDDFRGDDEINLFFITHESITDAAVKKLMEFNLSDPLFSNICAVVAESMSEKCRAVVWKNGTAQLFDGFSASQLLLFEIISEYKLLFGHDDVFEFHPDFSMDEILHEALQKADGMQPLFRACYLCAAYHAAECGKFCGYTDAVMFAMEKGVIDSEIGMRLLALRLTNGNAAAAKWTQSSQLAEVTQSLKERILLDFKEKNGTTTAGSAD